MSDHEPTGIGFDRWTAVAQLDKFPWLRGTQENLGFIPEVQMVREHEVDVLAILTPEHGEVAFDFSRKEGEPLVANGRPIEGAYREFVKIARLKNLRQDDISIIGGIGRRVGNRAIRLLKAGKTGVLDAIDLARSEGKKNFLGDVQSIGKSHGVIRPREHEGALPRAAHRWFVDAGAEASHMIHEILHEKAFGEIAQRRAGVGVFHSEFLEFSEKCRRVV